MTYYNIPKKILNIVIGEAYESGTYTLKDELDEVGEDLIYAFYQTVDYADKEKNFKRFTAWTKTYVLVLVDGGFGDQMLLKLPRNPPKK